MWKKSKSKQLLFTFRLFVTYFYLFFYLLCPWKEESEEKVTKVYPQTQGKRKVTGVSGDVEVEVAYGLN